MICSHSPDVSAGSEFDAVMHLQAALKFPHIKQEDPLFHLRDSGVKTLPRRGATGGGAKKFRPSPYMVETFYQIVWAHLPPVDGFDRCHNRVPPNV